MTLSTSDLRRFLRRMTRRERARWWRRHMPGERAGTAWPGVRGPRGRRVNDPSPRRGRHAHSYARHAAELRRHVTPWEAA